MRAFCNTRGDFDTEKTDIWNRFSEDPSWIELNDIYI